MKSQLQTESSPRFLDRIRTALADLQPAERRLGTFLLDFPGDMASYDAQELARLSDVSKATVSRFIRKIGYDSYDAARRAVRDEASSGSRLYIGHAEPGAMEDVLGFGMREEMENLAWTFQRITPDDLDRLAEKMLSARKVWIIGQRISHSFATYLRWQLVKVVPDAAVIPKDGESMGEHLAAMTADDLVLVVALRRRMSGLEVLLREIGTIGAARAVISDDSMEPDPSLDWHFRCRISTATPQFNHAAVLALCHQIVVRTTLKSGANGRTRLRRVDELNERLGEYD
ncbi:MULTISPECIES: MurR/RpiR family transcriptional regulator [Marivita]|uniref:MurR/RpiR family transcriptional regulator n=1 Tax=Marivita cryptomonadis TaxID=505252 RepID=A0A9Q2NWF5_9RHOB|nr:MULTISPECIES: MurR/RpiR family transcriptional regulator [Marivita]MCR9168715.1 MurR/RpiR family transcriptional regulator [Paracoccaceae bacterium]MBM2321004.1 MurR/RpiR family transcriptional regulator [Marivita cryptomonadis]MBM2330585.1 MurR/RpiR family transcriptional regulator [Marivita cryptomonadis]MBM2340171.1 MurR/RpiR family transcriptional regulator [Marivita cryptomonadis]MBM2344833.1 MurR/RpiR family transcriptional regulator [Marivita cryptomonadis]